MHNAHIIREVKVAARNKFAWPGGYPLMVVMHDADVICPDCARDNFARIARATRDETRDGWEADHVAIHWEGEPETCANCGVEIESAYGIPE